MSLTDYSDLENEIADAPEPKNLNAGEEVQGRIITVRTGISESEKYPGCRWYSVVFDVPDDPMVMEFNDFFWELNKEKLDAKTFSRELYKFQQFAKAFDIDFSRPFSWEDELPGKTGWLITGVKKTDEYGTQNTVKKYVAPR